MMNQSLPPVPGAMPSLTPQQTVTPGAAAATPRTLLDLMADGFYLLLMLKRGRLPQDAETFVQSVQRLLDTVERNAMKMGIASEDVYSAKYAFCAAVDEAVLSQASALQDAWERKCGPKHARRATARIRPARASAGQRQAGRGAGPGAALAQPVGPSPRYRGRHAVPRPRQRP
ncbi:DotU family type IV/VI secretion system protein [Luteimonas terrae]|uniref:DotU family type IV/VI secretion system protein n=1 Tax=Luteimonas terrae TaxID=1530191 RepID=UPI00286D1134|nr:DotU family type IV/VI secretion system protein [Luteimonas terrae]